MAHPHFDDTARFASDPSGLRVVKQLLEEQGFMRLKVVKSEQRHHDIIATKDGAKHFLKVSLSRTESPQLENEFEAAKFLQHAEGFIIPSAMALTHSGDASILDMEWIDFKPFVIQTDRGLDMGMSASHLENIFRFMLWLHRIPKPRVPDYFLDRARREFTFAKGIEKFHAYVEPAIGKLISREEVAQLEATMREIGDKRRFVHHDVVPWNIGVEKGGSLVLVDGEYARWGMKWYDVSYFFLQTDIMLGDAKLARRALAYFVQRFQEELPREQIAEEIFLPMSYRLGANINIALTNPTHRPRVKRLLRHILNRDLDALMGTRS